MSREFSRPVIVSSKCIEFDHCRYDGQMITSELVRKLKAHAEIRPVCMEAEIGLGVPRDSLRLVQLPDGRHLMQPATGRDVTREAEEFTTGFLAGQKDVDGFILKSRSPSCGSRDTKIYPPGEKMTALGSREAGVFGGMVMATYPLIAIEDENRLLNPRLAEHFLTRIFTMADFRTLKGVGLGALVEFHSDYKFLFMSLNQKGMRELGDIVANHAHIPAPQVEANYELALLKLLAAPPKCGSEINVMSHLFGFVSDGLKKDEKDVFTNSLEQYKKGTLPATVPLQLLRSYVARFGEPYLKRQTFLEPFPQEFMDVRNPNDACVGRALS